MGKFLFLIYGVSLGVLATKYVQAHEPKQTYRVTCDYKKYGFQWGTEEQIFGNGHKGFHCFMGAEVVKVDGFGRSPEKDLFYEESIMEILPPIVSGELKEFPITQTGIVHDYVWKHGEEACKNHNGLHYIAVSQKLLSMGERNDFPCEGVRKFACQDETFQTEPSEVGHCFIEEMQLKEVGLSDLYPGVVK